MNPGDYEIFRQRIDAEMITRKDTPGYALLVLLHGGLCIPCVRVSERGLVPFGETHTSEAGAWAAINLRRQYEADHQRKQPAP